MFTGIIEAVGRMISMRPYVQGMELDIDAGLDLSKDAISDSIAVDGVCLTVTAKKGSVFTATVSKETITRSTLGAMKPGSPVNIERALTLNARLGGHIVLGHVDTVAAIREKTNIGESIRYRIHLESIYKRYMIEKGSIAVDGISLTVNALSPETFELNLIPYTIRSTSLTAKGPGDRVNLEFDVIGKYIERLLEKGERDKGLEDLLKKQGFI
jgi:riboflavin synthase